MASATTPRAVIVVSVLVLHLACTKVHCANCWAPGFELHHNQPLSECWQGTLIKNSTHSSCVFARIPGTDWTNVSQPLQFDSLAKCCDRVGELKSRDDYHGINDALQGLASRAECLGAGGIAATVPATYVVFKGQDLPATQDVYNQRSNLPYTKVCGGPAALSKACVSTGCLAFTYGGDSTCGYLKGAYYCHRGGGGWSGNCPRPDSEAERLFFAPSTRGWSTYVLAALVPKSIPGGALDCVRYGGSPCNMADKFPKPSGTFNGPPRRFSRRALS